MLDQGPLDGNDRAGFGGKMWRVRYLIEGLGCESSSFHSSNASPMQNYLQNHLPIRIKQVKEEDLHVRQAGLPDGHAP